MSHLRRATAALEEHRCAIEAATKQHLDDHPVVPPVLTTTGDPTSKEATND